MISRQMVLNQTSHTFNRTVLWTNLMRDIETQTYEDSIDLRYRLQRYQLAMDCNDGLLRKGKDFWIRDYEANTVSALFTLRQEIESAYSTYTALEGINDSSSKDSGPSDFSF